MMKIWNKKYKVIQIETFYFRRRFSRNYSSEESLRMIEADPHLFETIPLRVVQRASTRKDWFYRTNRFYSAINRVRKLLKHRVVINQASDASVNKNIEYCARNKMISSWRIFTPRRRYLNLLISYAFIAFAEIFF